MLKYISDEHAKYALKSCLDDSWLSLCHLYCKHIHSDTNTEHIFISFSISKGLLNQVQCVATAADTAEAFRYTDKLYRAKQPGTSLTQKCFYDENEFDLVIVWSHAVKGVDLHFNTDRYTTWFFC